MMNLWIEKFQYSLAEQQAFDIQILKKHIPHCRNIDKTDMEQDKNGVDYVATLMNGAKVRIDAKTRIKGACRFWKTGEPELALEIYSVNETQKLGWTLSDSTDVDYILYTFDESDSNNYYFIPFQLLRKVFWENGESWVDTYGRKIQTSDSWHSTAVFVPASIVLEAVTAAMIGKR